MKSVTLFLPLTISQQELASCMNHLKPHIHNGNPWVHI